MFCSYTNPYKLSLCQPHSQGLSSSHPPGEWERRDPGKGWSCATLTIENIRKGSSPISTTTAITRNVQKQFWIATTNIPTFTYRLSRSVLKQFTVAVMLLPSYQLVVWKASHTSSSFFTVPQQNQLLAQSSRIPSRKKISPLNTLIQIDVRNIRMSPDKCIAF